uniref:Ataxin-10 n=1 Tax=Lutzomyia longipalpis TaxID=7200 RepID=A0A1B0CQV2_LUTLO
MFSQESIVSSIRDGKTSYLLEYIEENLKKHSLTHSRDDPDDPQCDFLESLQYVLEIFITSTSIYLEGKAENGEDIAGNLLKSCLKFMKISCVHGKALQGMIVKQTRALEAMKSILQSHLKTQESATIKKWTWHLLANVLVDNVETLKIMWPPFGNFLLKELLEDHENSGTTAAVIYYSLRLALLNNVQEIPTVEMFRHIIGALERNVESSGSNRMDFIHLSFEFLLTESDKFGEIFSQLSEHDRIWMIYYITDHVKDSQEGDIRKDVLLYLPREFNKKSECILNSKSPKYHEDDPKEVMALLRCFVAVTGSEKYGKIYSQEGSFFINVCALLVAVQTLSSQGDAPFAPLGKLEDFSSTSEAAQEAEKEIFFELKTLLVRLIANLSHKNRKNQDLAREMKALLTICGCTTMDARNPMMKEWAIVALKNLLEGNAENQNVIHSLVNQGPAANEVLAELMMENGSVRINRN